MQGDARETLVIVLAAASSRLASSGKKVTTDAMYEQLRDLLKKALVANSQIDFYAHALTAAFISVSSSHHQAAWKETLAVLDSLGGLVRDLAVVAMKAEAKKGAA